MKTTNKELKAEVMRVKDELAFKHLETKDFHSAAQSFLDLSNRTAEQKDEVDQSGESTQLVRKLEEKELMFMLEYGNALAQTPNYPAAEKTYDEVLKKLEDTSKVSDVSNRLARNGRRELCRVLLQQGSKEKLQRARCHYWAAGNLKASDVKHIESHSWTILSYFYIEFINMKLFEPDMGLDHLRYVWSRRHEASKEVIQEIESRTIELVQLFIKSNQDQWAENLITAICSGDHTLPSPLVIGLLELFIEQNEDRWARCLITATCEGVHSTSPHIANAIIESVLSLHGTGEVVRAVELLLAAWGGILSTEPGDDLLNLAWSLSWSLCKNDHFGLAESLLNCLFSLSHRGSQPSKFQVQALLAHALLVRGHFQEAKENAQAVYDVCGIDCILQYQGYHHADTLIRAIVEADNGKDRWTNALEIWGKIYNRARKLRSSETNREQLQHHANAGFMLAERWEASRKGNGKANGKRVERSRRRSSVEAQEKIGTIRRQANELQKTP